MPSDLGSKPARHGDQELVARRVADAVVDELEAIEVEEKETGARRIRLPKQRAQAIHDQAPVGQAGQ